MVERVFWQAIGDRSQSEMRLREEEERRRRKRGYLLILKVKNSYIMFQYLSHSKVVISGLKARHTTSTPHQYGKKSGGNEPI